MVSKKLRVFSLILILGCLLSALIDLSKAQAEWLEEFSISENSSEISSSADLAAKQEKRLHELFQVYHSRPTPPEVWQEMVKQLSSLNYTVLPGDTLFDISEVFFGDAQFWPKIWSLNNPQILNPHLIQPGMVITFSLGSAQEPPSVKVNASEKKDEGVSLTTEEGQEIEGAGISAQGSQQQGESPAELLKRMELYKIPGAPPREEIPPELLDINREIVSGLPNSFPEWHYRGPLKPTLSKIDFRVDAVVPDEKVKLLFYASEERPEELGRFVSSEWGHGEMQSEHFVFVRGRGLTVGSTYLVVNQTNRIRSKRNRARGWQWQVRGTVRILSPVGSSVDLFRAQVVEAFSNLNESSILTLGSVKEVSLSQSSIANETSAQAQVVGGAGESSRSMFARGELLYLDAGASVGLNAGVTLRLFRNEQARNPSLRGIDRSARSIGLAKVIHVTPQFSTAVVLDSSEEIRVGDQTSAQ